MCFLSIHHDAVAAKREERMNRPMSEVVKMVSKKEIEPWVNSLVLEICCNDLEGEDVEVCQ
jgi:ubiquitin-activating enzyme E1